MRCSLSPLQLGMLLKSVDSNSRDMYIIQTVFDWKEHIFLPAFLESWRQLAAGHETLRSSFHWQDTSRPSQEIHPEITPQFEVLKFRCDTPEEKEKELRGFLTTDLKRGFSLSEAPPWRVSVMLFSDGSQIAIWTAHHLLLDGRSHVTLLRELLSIYDSSYNGSKPTLDRELPQRLHVQWMERQDTSRSRNFWFDYLNSEKLSTALPNIENAAQKLVGHASYNRRLGKDLTTQINNFAMRVGVSPGNIIQAAWALVLGWLANETDVVFGAVRACRKSGLPNGAKIIGVVINTLPLRVRWNAEDTLLSIVQNVGKDWRAFRDHEHTPLQEIGKWVGLQLNRELFTTAVSFSSEYFSHAVVGKLPGSENRQLWLQQTTPYCAVDASFDGDELHLTVSLPVAATLPSVAEKLTIYLQNTIHAIVHTPQSLVRNLSPFDTEERAMLIQLNQHWENPPGTIDWLARLSVHTRNRGEQTALIGPDETLSWQSLEGRSNQLARFLSNRDIGRTDLIAVFLPRSSEFVRICLGILKSGAAYLPLDPDWPCQRVVDILEDSGVKGVITSQDLAPQLASFNGQIWMAGLAIDGKEEDAFSSPSLTPQDLAYVIYTSGSTGKPKGVEIVHGGLQNLIDDMISTFALSENDRASLVSSPAFDATVHEVWPSLTAGASVHIPNAELRKDPRALLNWLEASKISFSFLSTAMAEAVTQLCGDRCLSLRYLLTGGDKLRVVPTHALPFTLVNEYGPTESSVITTRYNVDPSADANVNIPIGQPITGIRGYVVNQSFQLMPAGVPGELLLAGSSLARGYRNRPELTASKFVANFIPEEFGQALYRTGDLVRWHSDGNLQFLGRIDSQLKLRGFRIELGEIEASLLRHPSVTEAVVILQSEKAPRLVAFVVVQESANGIELEAKLRAFLLTVLPDYMVPSTFVVRPNLPVNSSGKYDRKALSAITVDERESAPAGSDVPLSDTEKQIISIWEKTLNISRIQATDRFLALGGTSLSIIQLLCALEVNFGKALTATDILNDPTPRELAKRIETESTEETSCLVSLKSSGSKPPILMIPGAGGGVHWFRHLAASFDPDRPMLGLELLSLSPESQSQFSVSGAAAELTSIVKAIDGAEPYTLCGYSGGGVLALEIAASLTAQGKKVNGVILLETHPSREVSGGFNKAKRWVKGWLSLPASERGTVLLSRLRFFRNELANKPATSTKKVDELQALKDRHIHAFGLHEIAYNGRVAVVCATQRPLSTEADPRKEWNGLLTGEVKFVQVPGDHYTMLSGSNSEQLSRLMGWLTDDFSGPSVTSDSPAHPEPVAIS